MRAFRPLIANPHVLTILGNFWPRRYPATFPVRAVHYQTDEHTRILVHEQQPESASRGEVVMVHGLEGSSDAGYMRSMAQTLVQAGYTVHRTNIRGCGGTESLCRTLYHSGLTSDVRYLLVELKRQRRGPVFLVGFSLGGNQVLKLAGELGHDATDLIRAICAVCTPIDLAACVRALGRPANFLYEQRFVSRMKQRLLERHRLMPEVFRVDALPGIRTVYQFDDRVTAPFFGFGTADNYYSTQSAIRFLDRIRVPTWLLASVDDPMVPFDVYSHPSIRQNPCLELAGIPHGGHIGFVSRTGPRFWLDSAVTEWIAGTGTKEGATSSLTIK